MLNREKAPWKGSWNGVGGKIAQEETPLFSTAREIKEETGLTITSPDFKGIVTWVIDGDYKGGMYLYAAELSSGEHYPTPKKTREGILDWKSVDWLVDKENTGVAGTVPKFLMKMLKEDECFEYQCIFQGDILTDCITRPYKRGQSAKMT